MKKYNANFERDFNWYLRVKHLFDFDGVADYFNKNGSPVVQYDKNGVSGKEAFYQYDTNGKIVPTKHPNLLFCLLKTKGSVNLHIKMYAEDRANGLFSLVELRGVCMYKLKTPPYWFKEAIENQKVKYWKF